MRRKRRDLVIGRKPVHELLESGDPVEKVFLLKGAKGDSIKLIRDAARNAGVPTQDVPRPRLDYLHDGNHQGVVAVTSPIRYYKLSDVLPGIWEKGEAPFIVLLDGVTDVRNFGAIARTVAGAGAHALVIGARDAAPANPEAVKASAGTLRNVIVCREPSIRHAMMQMKDYGIPLYGLAADGDKTPSGLDLSEPLAWVLGSEESGISEANLKLLDRKVRLPISDLAESYNVSVAAGMACYATMVARDQD